MPFDVGAIVDIGDGLRVGLLLDLTVTFCVGITVFFCVGLLVTLEMSGTFVFCADPAVGSFIGDLIGCSVGAGLNLGKPHTP